MSDIHERATRCLEIIGQMCKDGRPPKMSIPVQPTDEDVVLTETIIAMVARIKEQDSTWLSLMRELAVASDAAGIGDGDWALATDDILLEQFDPWATMADVRKTILVLSGAL